MSSVASGWYARLDHVCPDRVEQLEKWIDSWEEAVLHRMPIAATMPGSWPTLPAGLISDPGAVLEHLLARHEAVSDGRSPRGAYSTPDRLVRAVLADELKGHSKSTKEPPSTLSLAAMPPAFRAYAGKLNQTALNGSEGLRKAPFWLARLLVLVYLFLSVIRRPLEELFRAVC